MEPDDFPPFVLGEAVLMQEIDGVVPLAMDAEVEDAHAQFVGDFGKVMFWARRHEGFNTEPTEDTEATGEKNIFFVTLNNAEQG